MNPAYERLFGYTSEEVLDKDSRELTKSDRNKADQQDTINAQLRKAKVRGMVPLLFPVQFGVIWLYLDIIVVCNLGNMDNMVE